MPIDSIPKMQMPAVMKALTICNPYPNLILPPRLEKRVENRTWPTPYRGPLLIHAGKSLKWLASGEVEYFAMAGDPLIFGAILGVCNLVDCLHIKKIRAGEYDEKYPWLRHHPHAHGDWCWILTDAQRLKEPIHPYKGAQGLFNVPYSVVEHVLPPPPAVQS